MSRAEAEALLLAGVSAAKLGALSDAAQAWGKLLNLAPPPDLLTQAWFNLGLLCVKSNDTAAAVACQHKALLADPANHEAREHLALLLAEQGELVEAIAAFELLVHSAPQARYHFNLGILLSQQGAFLEAENHYRQGLMLQPDYADALSNLGLLLAERGLSAEALECLKRAAASAPNHPQVFANLGALLEAESHLDMAAVCLQRAVELTPDSAVAHCNLGVLQVERGELALAEQNFRRAMQLDPDYLSAPAYLAQLLLSTERYAEGWALHEVRFALAEKNGKPFGSPFSCPLWRGEPLQDKAILIRPEQGYGDEIQFARYIPLLRNLGARHITLLARSALLPVLQTLAGVDTVLDADHLEGELPEHDYWITSMSLPHHLQQAIPASLPYLSVPAESRQHWAFSLSESKAFRVGLLWQGNVLHQNDAHRSLPGVETLLPLWQVAGVEFISLQRERVEVGAAQGTLIQFGTEIVDFGDAAAIVDQLDLVISVDSAYAHLAGALGKPVWVLLPKRNTDWRWQQQGTDSPWYPGVMRLFRQSQRGDWDSVLIQVRQALLALLESRQVQAS